MTLGSRKAFTLIEITMAVGITAILMFVVLNQMGWMRTLQESSSKTTNLEGNIVNLNRDMQFAFDRGRNLVATNYNDTNGIAANPTDPTLFVSSKGAVVVETDLRPCLGTNPFNPSTTATNVTKVAVVCCGTIAQSKTAISINSRASDLVTIKANLSFKPNCPKPGLVYAKFNGTTNAFISRDCLPDFTQFATTAAGYSSITNDVLYHFFVTAQTLTSNGKIPAGGARVRNLEKYYSLGNTGSGMSTYCREQLQ